MVRVFGVLLSLPIFGATGGVMLPTVTIASIAVWTAEIGRFGRRERIARIVFLAHSLAILIKLSSKIVFHFRWTIPTRGRIFLFAIIDGLVIISMRPTLNPFKNENAAPRKLSK